MNTLRGRLVIVFMILSLGGLAVIGFLGMNNSGKALIESAEREGMALGKGVAGETELFFGNGLIFFVFSLSGMLSDPWNGNLRKQDCRRL